MIYNSTNYLRPGQGYERHSPYFTHTVRAAMYKCYNRFRCINTYIYIYIYVYIHTYVSMYIYIYIYIYRALTEPLRRRRAGPCSPTAVAPLPLARSVCTPLHYTYIYIYIYIYTLSSLARSLSLYTYIHMYM